MKLTIDFETRSEASLRGQGAYVYASHPSTDVLCLVFKEDGKEPVVWVPPQFRGLYNDSKNNK